MLNQSVTTAVDGWKMLEDVFVAVVFCDLFERVELGCYISTSGMRIFFFPVVRFKGSPGTTMLKTES